MQPNPKKHTHTQNVKVEICYNINIYNIESNLQQSTHTHTRVCAHTVRYRNHLYNANGE